MISIYYTGNFQLPSVHNGHGLQWDDVAHCLLGALLRSVATLPTVCPLFGGQQLVTPKWDYDCGYKYFNTAYGRDHAMIKLELCRVRVM